MNSEISELNKLMCNKNTDVVSMFTRLRTDHYGRDRIRKDGDGITSTSKTNFDEYSDNEILLFDRKINLKITNEEKFYSVYENHLLVSASVLHNRLIQAAKDNPNIPNVRYSIEDDIMWDMDYSKVRYFMGGEGITYWESMMGIYVKDGCLNIFLRGSKPVCEKVLEIIGEVLEEIKDCF